MFYDAHASQYGGHLLSEKGPRVICIFEPLSVQDFGLRITFKHHCIYTQTLYASTCGHAVVIVPSFPGSSDVGPPSRGPMWGGLAAGGQPVPTQHQCDTGEAEQPVHHTSTMEQALLQVREQ